MSQELNRAPQSPELNHEQVKAVYASTVALRILHTLAWEHVPPPNKKTPNAAEVIGNFSRTLPSSAGPIRVDATAFFEDDDEVAAASMGDYDKGLPAEYHDLNVSLAGIVTFSREFDDANKDEFTFWQIHDEQSDLHGGVVIMRQETRRDEKVLLDESGVDLLVQLLLETDRNGIPA